MKVNKATVTLAGLLLLASGDLCFAQQRSPGAAGNATRGNAQDEMKRELERALNTNAGFVADATALGAWWMDPGIVAKLALSNDQVARIEKIFDAHRQSLTSTLMQLERDEMELKRLLDAETVDRGAVRTQVDRVIRSRGEMERANANMTLEMREQLTRAQWLQVTQLNAYRVYTRSTRSGR